METQLITPGSSEDLRESCLFGKQFTELNLNNLVIVNSWFTDSNHSYCEFNSFFFLRMRKRQRIKSFTFKFIIETFLKFFLMSLCVVAFQQCCGVTRKTSDVCKVLDSNEKRKTGRWEDSIWTQLSTFISVTDNWTGQLLSRCMKEGGRDGSGRQGCAYVWGEWTVFLFMHVWDLKSLCRLHLFVRTPHSAALCPCLMLQGGLTGCEWPSLLSNGGLPRGVKPSVALISMSHAQTWQGSSVCTRVCVYSFACFSSFSVISPSVPFWHFEKTLLLCGTVEQKLGMRKQEVCERMCEAESV